MSPTFDTTERDRLSSFRAASRQVREASIIAEGQDIKIQAVPGAPGFVDLVVQLLESEAFRSMALAVRLVYQQGEPAHFQSICGIIHRRCSEAIQQRVATIRQQYHDALRDKDFQVVVGDLNTMAVFTAQGVLETWLYGVAFHQDLHRQPSVKLLTEAGVEFPWVVQATLLKLAGRVLDLDDVVAEVLDEPPLPRIGAAV